MTEVTTFGFALFSLYAILLAFVSLQLGRIVYYRHKIKSFQVGILIQCWVWLVFRAVFFLFTDDINHHNWLSLIMYWLPVNIQFAIFSLLVVYYAQLGHEHKGAMKAFKNKYIIVWAITNTVFLILAAIWISIGSMIDKPNATEPEWLSSVHGYFTGTVFFILVLVLARECFRVSQLMRQSPGAQTKMLAKISFPKIVIVTFLLFLLFTSRCVYDILSATGNVNIEVSNGTDFAAAFTFAALLAWEIIPTILVLVLFGYVKSTSLGVFHRRHTPAVSSFHPRSSMDAAAAQPLIPKVQMGPGAIDQRRYNPDEDSQNPFHTPYNTGNVGNVPTFTV